MPWPRSDKAANLPPPNVHSADCPTRSILDSIMSRWGSLVLVLLLDQSYRFSELAYLIGGVSEKMLSQTLRRLEADGFLRRVVHATKPPKVEYSLSPLGRELALHVQQLVQFIHSNAEDILAQRKAALTPVSEKLKGRRAPMATVA